MPCAPQGVKGIIVVVVVDDDDDDDDDTYVILNKNLILTKYPLIVPILK